MQVFEGKQTKVIQSDVFDGLATIEDNSVDLIFIDPPYNIGKKFGDFVEKWENEDDYIEWCYKWIDLCIKKLKNNGSMYIMTSTEAMPYFDIFIRKKMKILSRIV